MDKAIDREFSSARRQENPGLTLQSNWASPATKENREYSDCSCSPFSNWACHPKLYFPDSSCSYRLRLPPKKPRVHRLQLQPCRLPTSFFFFWNYAALVVTTVAVMKLCYAKIVIVGQPNPKDKSGTDIARQTTTNTPKQHQTKNKQKPSGP